MLLDHFHPPLSDRRHAHSFLLAWVVYIAAWINKRLPNGWFAEPYVHIQKPPFDESFFVHIRNENKHIVALIVLVSPAEKHEKETRQFFVSHYATWITRGASMVIVDIVTTRKVDLHRKLCHFLDPKPERPIKNPLFAAAYHQVGEPMEMQFDIQHEPLSIGGPLPTISLCLKNGRLMPVDLRATYQKALQAVGITPDTTN